MYNLYLNKKINIDTYITTMLKYDDDYKKKEIEYKMFINDFDAKFRELSFDKRKEVIQRKVDSIFVDMNLKIPIKVNLKNLNDVII